MKIYEKYDYCKYILSEEFGLNSLADAARF